MKNRLQRHWRRCSSMQDLHRGEIAISSRLSTVPSFSQRRCTAWIALLRMK
jgi:hypothetical protein